jgi:hypothetical protein
MSRKIVKRCDICKRETDTIVGKLHWIPSIPGVTKLVHSNYTHHADVGACCKDKIFKVFSFQKRQTFSEYQDSRKRNQVYPAGKP